MYRHMPCPGMCPGGRVVPTPANFIQKIHLNLESVASNPCPPNIYIYIVHELAH